MIPHPGVRAMRQLSFKKGIAELDRLIGEFTRLSKEYPGGTYGESLLKLKTERAELASQIGKSPTT